MKKILTLILVLAAVLSVSGIALADEAVTLDIANGSIEITATGYQQGDAGLVEWGTNTEHKLTIKGSKTQETPLVLVKGGNPIITLDNVTMALALDDPNEDWDTAKNKRHPAVAVYTGQSATIILSGDNAVTSWNGGGMQVAKDATVTIKGNGTLTGSVGSAVLNTYTGGDNTYRAGGNVFLESGTLKTALYDGNGGVNFTMTGGTMEGAIKTTQTVSITGGNINDGYTGEITGRKLTKLYIVDASGNPVTSKVTIKEGGNEWSAVPDDNGVITTYLAEDTTSLIYNEVSYPVTPGKDSTLGVSCSCATGGSISWAGVPAEITIYTGNDSKTVTIAAEFVKDSSCLAPVHPVDVVLSIEGEAASNGSITDNKLTVKYVENGYNLTLKAVAGTLAQDTKTIKVNCVAEKGFDLNEGSVTVFKDGDNVVYEQGSKKYTTTSTDKVVFTGTSSENNIEISTDATIVLRDLSLTDITAKSPIKITGNAEVTLWLEGDNTLTTGTYNHDDGTDRVNGLTTAAIFVESGSTLIIDSEAGTLTNDDIDADHYGDKQQGYAGSLLAKNTGTRGGASAIGGDYFADPNMACGNITIKGGNVTAQATLASSKFFSGAAIGSGYTGADGSVVPDAMCGDITITGGNIRALAAEGNTTPGRAISSGVGDLTITGGVIYASAPNDGWNGDSAGSIYSHNGTLTIGEANGDDSDLYIYAGTTTKDVTHTDSAAPAIGVSSGGTLNILSGTITAESTGNGPAIGVAAYAPVKDEPVELNIKGGTIKLTLADETQAGTPAAIGIGGNNHGNKIEINISGGSIESDELNIGTRKSQDSKVNISGDAEVNIKNGNLVGDLNTSGTSNTTIGGNVSGDVTVGAGSTVIIAGEVQGTLDAAPGSIINGELVPEPSAGGNTGGSYYSGPSIWYVGGNTFGTSTTQMPTSVEIDYVSVPFTMEGSNIVVSCINPGARWATVKWNSTSATIRFNPDANVVCAQVVIPKTGDMPIWAAIAEFLGF